jgi:hypothetical protein
VQWNGGRIKDLIGGRWSSWRQVLADFAALPFWVIWEATARLVYALLYPHSSPSNAYQVPTGPAEIFLWLLVSLAAGFCEELVFRGYCSVNSTQRQEALPQPLGCKRSSLALCTHTKVGNRCSRLPCSAWRACRPVP